MFLYKARVINSQIKSHCLNVIFSGVVFTNFRIVTPATGSTQVRHKLAF